MTPTEINEAVGKKLGWKNICIRTEGSMSPMDVLVGIHPSRQCKIHQEAHDHVPHYSTDISAAWELLDKTTSWLIGKHFEGGYFCRLVLEDGVYEVEADTAPLAICLAFLKLP